MGAVAPRRDSPALRAAWLGRIDYDAALALQTAAAAAVAAGGEERLFLLEHEPVYTLGRNATAADILFTPERRRELGVAVRESNRGGKVTYHGPGQLVGYPILNLSPDRRDVKRYVTDLEEVLIRALAELGVRAARASTKSASPPSGSATTRSPRSACTSRAGSRRTASR